MNKDFNQIFTDVFTYVDKNSISLDFGIQNEKNCQIFKIDTQIFWQNVADKNSRLYKNFTININNTINIKKIVNIDKNGLLVLEHSGKIGRFRDNILTPISVGHDIVDITAHADILFYADSGHI